MRGPRLKLALAAGVAAAVAIPATVIAGAGNEESGLINFQSIDRSQRQEIKSKSFTDVPGLAVVNATGGTADLAVAMSKGKAEFRLVSNSEDAIVAPRLTFSAPRAESFVYFLHFTCQPVKVQWRRVGDVKPAVLSAASLRAISQTGCG